MALEDVYKRMLLARGGSEVGSVEINTKNNTNMNFKKDYSYRLSKLMSPDLTQADLDIRVINEDKTINDKSFMVRPDTHIDAGAYIIYDSNDEKKVEKTYIITEFEDNLISPEARGTRCNQSIKLPDVPVEFSKGFPCMVSNDSYGSKLLSDNELLSMGDEKCNITVQANAYTLKIKPNYRFIFMNSKYGIFRVFSINVSFKDGVITFICRKDLYKEGLDDLDNNLAWQSDYMLDEDSIMQDFIIYGDDAIKLGGVKDYTITDIPNGDITWSLTDPDVCTIVSSTKTTCKVRALRANGICILVAKNGLNTISERVIVTER